MTEHAFAFANFAEGHDDSFLNIELVERMFGSEVCQPGSSPCMPSVAARAFMARANEAMGGGRCEGFAVMSSLLEADVLAAGDFGGSGSVRELSLPDNAPLQRELAYWFATQLVPETASATRSYMAKDVMPALVDALTPGATERYRIGIVSKKGDVVSGGHSLTPIAYDRDPRQEGVYRVRVYDSNNPDNERILVVDTENNRWEFETEFAPTEPSTLYSGDETNNNPLYLTPVLARQGVRRCFFCGDDADMQVVASGGAQVSVATPSGSVGWVDGVMMQPDGGLVAPNFSNLSGGPLVSTVTVSGTGGDAMVNIFGNQDSANVGFFPKVNLNMGSSSTTVSTNNTIRGLSESGNAPLTLSVSPSSSNVGNALLKLEGNWTGSTDNNNVALNLSHEVQTNTGTSVMATAMVGGNATDVNVMTDRQTGMVTVQTNGSKDTQVTLVVMQTKPDNTTSSAQLTFTSTGSSTLTADSNTVGNGNTFTGMLDNDGQMQQLTDACEDGVVSGGESDVDCGAVCDDKCQPGESCNSGADCISTFCNDTSKRCVETSCEDGKLSGQETDIDCGGSDCAACVTGSACANNSDCESGACVGSTCVGTFAIGFTVSGLPGGAAVTLENNGIDTLDVSSNGSFTFATPVTGTYNVQVSVQPAVATCTVTNGSGTATADVNNISVTCVPTYAISGMVSGLQTGEVVTLQNGGELLALSQDGPFTFAQRTQGAYDVSVATQPVGQACAVTNGSGTAMADVTDIVVTCVTDPHPVGGVLSGLPALESVTLQNNGTDDLMLTADGVFTFGTPVVGYTVTVLTQPATGFCSVTNGSGAATAPVTDVMVDCVPTYTIGGSLAGLAAQETVVIQNGTEMLSLSQNGPFVFNTRTTGAYDVTVVTQPSGQTCSVTNGSGTATADVTNVVVTCSANVYSIGGTLSGLPGGASVTLQNNGADDLMLSADGPFTFATQTSTYNVTVLTQPTGATCTVTNGSGTATADVTNVGVTCNPSSGGMLDTTFNGTGYLSVDFSANTDWWLTGHANADSSIIVGGVTNAGGLDDNWIVSKVLPTGVIDTTFGTNGHLVVDRGATFEEVRGIFADGTGYLIAGTLFSTTSSTPSFGVARITAAGALDNTFGTNGIVIHDTGQDQFVQDAQVDASGRIVMVGWTTGGIGLPIDLIVGRINANGTLDTTFGTNGWIVYDSGGGVDDEAYGVAIHPSGQITVAGRTGGDTLLLRYDSSGASVNTFGTNGVAVLDIAGGGLFELTRRARPDGENVIIVGNVDNGIGSDFMISKVTSAGTLDGTFGTNGTTTLNLGPADFAYDVVAVPGGGWYASGFGGANMIVARFTATGQPDATFGTNGVFQSSIVDGATGWGVFVDPMQRPLVCGSITSGINETLGIVRLVP